jgi:hypothetical protein
MLTVILVPFFLILHDYLKSPIDRLYFRKPMRPLVGMRNTMVDIINWGSKCSVNNHPGLWLVKAHFDKIREEFKEVSKTAETHLFHELDPWFEVNYMSLPPMSSRVLSSTILFVNGPGVPSLQCIHSAESLVTSHASGIQSISSPNFL